MRPEAVATIKRIRALGDTLERELKREHGINWNSIETTLDALDFTAGHVRKEIKAERAKAEGQQSIFASVTITKETESAMTCGTSCHSKISKAIEMDDDEPF